MLKSVFAYCALSVFVFISSIVLGENIFKIDPYEGSLNDTMKISLEIINDDPFIAFQCDLVLPENLSYIDGSAVLTNRKNDHVLVASLAGPGRIRFISYSNSNQFFKENEGSILELEICTGHETGIYPLEIQDAVIGNANSQNILTGLQNSEISIVSSGLFEYFTSTLVSKLYPNPANEVLYLDLEVVNAMEIILYVYTQTGKELTRRYIGKCSKGKHTFTFYNRELFQESPPGIYLLKLQGINETHAFHSDITNLILFR